MAELESDMRQAETERDSLQKTISDVEAAIGASTPGTRSVFQVFLLNARGRLETVERKIKESKTELEKHEREQVGLASLVQREAALNAKEKEAYSGFLKEEFFTKKDFGRLEEFYTKTWDRLSEQGKDAMSHRIWEGVRKGQYTFSEMPKAVREKETLRAYGALTKQSDQSADVSKIPARDRQDFIRAYDAGKQPEAERVLNRDSFKKALFRAPESAAREHGSVDRGSETERAGVAASVARSKPQDGFQKTPEAAKQGDKDLAAFGLEGVKLVSVESQGTSAEIPNARTARAAERGSAPGS